MAKKCVSCKKEKSNDFFSVRKKSKDGLQSKCKECKSLYEKNLRLKHPERYKRYRRNNKSNKIYLFRYKHNFERDEALEMLRKQGGCAICKVVLPEDGGHWYVDHDHNCCKQLTSCEKCRRGILCRGCNLMLGQAKDNIEILLRAIEYLNKYDRRR